MVTLGVGSIILVISAFVMYVILLNQKLLDNLRIERLLMLTGVDSSWDLNSEMGAS